MLTSTLAGLPGENKRYQVKGVVCSTVEVYSHGQTNFSIVLQELEKQATNLGADAIIDVKINLSDQIVVMTGTAIKITV